MICLLLDMLLEKDFMLRLLMTKFGKSKERAKFADD
jgi:hypothetical protein